MQLITSINDAIIFIFSMPSRYTIFMYDLVRVSTINSDLYFLYCATLKIFTLKILVKFVQQSLCKYGNKFEQTHQQCNKLNY